MKRTWRQRLAWRLRRWADRLDGCYSYAFELTGCTPADLKIALQTSAEVTLDHLVAAVRAREALEELTAKS